MRLARVVVRELVHHRVNAGLAVLAVALATAAVGIALVVLAEFRQRSEVELERRRAEVAATAEELRDEVRKIMKRLGFNLRILPADIDLASVYSEGYAAATMPESYADRLANWTDAEGQPVVTINHLLPALRRKLRWPEADGRTVVVVGIKGQVPLAHGGSKKPIEQPVAAGQVKVGHELAEVLELAVDDELNLLGRKYTVAEIHSARGNIDDISLWIPLADAQALFDEPGRINEIWALGCNCSTDDLTRLSAIRDEVQGILPDTRVIEDLPAAMTRALARNEAEVQAAAAIEADAVHRAHLQRERELLATLVVGLVSVLAAAWVGLLALFNLRERRGELALWRAMGLSGSRVAALVLARAAVVGLVGALLGFAASVIAALALGSPALLPGLGGILLLLSAAPLITVLASWLPTLHTLVTDPATILREQG